MKKYFFLLCFPILFAAVCDGHAQNVSINTTGAAPDASAILDISSNSKGVLVPRLAPWERANIQDPAQGLLVYDTGSRSFWYYDGGWIELAGGGGLPTGSAGGDLSGDYPTPNVVKLQNLDVSSAFPFDKQVLKWDALENNWKGRNDSLFLPYNSTSAQNGSPLFGITTNSTTNGSTAVYGKRGSTGSGITPSTTMGVWGDNSTGLGLLGTSNTGVGAYGISFGNHGMYGYSTLTGFAGVAGSNATEGGIGVLGTISQAGYGVVGKSSGSSGNAGYFINESTINEQPTVNVQQNGKGSAMTLLNSDQAIHPLLKLDSYGANVGLLVNNWNSSTGYTTMHINNAGEGRGFYCNNQNAGSTNASIYAYHFGPGDAIYGSSALGTAGDFNNNNSNNNSIILQSFTNGKGMAGSFQKNNTTGQVNDPHDPCVYVNNNSKGHALKVYSGHSPSINHGIDVEYIGQGYGININSTKGGLHAVSTNTDNWAVLSENNYGGGGIKSVVTGNEYPAMLGENQHTNGVGVVGTAQGNFGVGVKGITANTYNFGASIIGTNTSQTTGNGIFGETYANEGVGVKGLALSEDAIGVEGRNTMGGDGVRGYSYGDHARGVVGESDANSGTIGAGVYGINTGAGYGVVGISGANGAGIAGYDRSPGIGNAGKFAIQHSGNSEDVVEIENNGVGNSLYINSTNASNASTTALITKAGSGDFAIFEYANGDNKIRFDHAGKGYFDGGTQTGGADIAEVFDTEKEVTHYEPGDVMVISLEADRMVTKSCTPYSSLVAGVYATKPGVLMSEEHIDADLSDKIPMGIVGVIPTKVCLEGGPIRRGDLIVTSSLPGVAMKADPDKVKIGQVIGKSLENYDAEEMGLIKILVSIK